MLKLYTEFYDSTNDPIGWGRCIKFAEGDNRIHSGIVEEDGSIFSSRLGKGVYRQTGVDLSNTAKCKCVILPWADTSDCRAWRDAQIGLPYDLFGACVSLTGEGFSFAGGWFCSHLANEVISRLVGAPQGLTPLPDPATLDDEICQRLGLMRNTLRAKPDYGPLAEFVNGRLLPI